MTYVLYILLLLIFYWSLFGDKNHMYAINKLFDLLNVRYFQKTPQIIFSPFW